MRASGRSGAGNRAVNRGGFNNRGAGNRGAGNRGAGNRGGFSNRGGGVNRGGGGFSNRGAGNRGGGFGNRGIGGGGRGGGGSRGGGGGGRRSDIQLKHDVVRIGTVAEGIGLYRFQYNWSDQVYVGVIAQEVQAVRPDAVVRGHDGYLRVDYGAIGAPFQTWEQWSASGGATNH